MGNTDSSHKLEYTTPNVNTRAEVSFQIDDITIKNQQQQQQFSSFFFCLEVVEFSDEDSVGNISFFSEFTRLPSVAHFHVKDISYSFLHLYVYEIQTRICAGEAVFHLIDLNEDCNSTNMEIAVPISSYLLRPGLSNFTEYHEASRSHVFNDNIIIINISNSNIDNNIISTKSSIVSDGLISAVFPSIIQSEENERDNFLEDRKRSKYIDLYNSYKKDSKFEDISKYIKNVVDVSVYENQINHLKKDIDEYIQYKRRFLSLEFKELLLADFSFHYDSSELLPDNVLELFVMCARIKNMILLLQKTTTNSDSHIALLKELYKETIPMCIRSDLKRNELMQINIGLEQHSEELENVNFNLSQKRNTNISKTENLSISSFKSSVEDIAKSYSKKLEDNSQTWINQYSQVTREVEELKTRIVELESEVSLSNQVLNKSYISTLMKNNNNQEKVTIPAPNVAIQHLIDKIENMEESHHKLSIVNNQMSMENEVLKKQIEGLNSKALSNREEFNLLKETKISLEEQLKSNAISHEMDIQKYQAIESELRHEIEYLRTDLISLRKFKEAVLTE